MSKYFREILPKRHEMRFIACSCISKYTFFSRELNFASFGRCREKLVPPKGIRKLSIHEI